MQSQAHTVSRSNFQHPDLRATQTGPGRSGQSHQNKETSSTWSDDDEALSPGDSKFYSELFALYTHEDPVDTAPARNLNITQDNLKTRPATAFPGGATSSVRRGYTDAAQYTSEQKGPAPAKPPAHSFLKKHFKKAKEIYKNGPPGEAELFWTGVKIYLQNREPKEVIEMVPPKKRYETTKRTPARGTNRAPANKQKQRQGSAVSYDNVSHHSREVPFVLHQTAAEMDRPLPRYPPVDATFGQRPQKGKGKALNVDKPLPITPMPCSLSALRRAKASELESPVDADWASVGMQTVDGNTPPVSIAQRKYQAHLRPEVPLPQTSTRGPQKPSPVYGSQTPAGKYKSSSSSKEREKARNALKAKISRPIAIEPPVDMSTAQILPQYMFERRETKGKQKAPPSPGWLDKFTHPTMPTMPTMPDLPALPALNKGKKRRDSDESFACQGIVGQGEHNPAPLFTGEGDSSGYRMTGRWI